MTWAAEFGIEDCPDCTHPKDQHKFGGQCTVCEKHCRQPVAKGKPWRFPWRKKEL